MEKMTQKSVLFFFIFLFSTILKSQDAELFDAKRHFDHGHYNKAQNLFINTLINDNDNEDEILYFIALCSKNMQSDDSEYWYSRLINNYSTSYFADFARRDLAFIYFSKKNYKKSVELFKDITNVSLFDEDYYFKYGYSLFSIENYDDANYYFYKIKNSDSKYRSFSIYYYAHISYLQELYELSLQDFKLLQSDKVFGSIVPYYISQIYFVMQDYQNLINYAVPYLDKVIPSRIDELNRFIAESYYQLSDFINAEVYLKRYLKSSDEISKLDYFQLGHVNVVLEDFNESIYYLEKIDIDSDSLSQYVLYYLGESYLKVGKKEFALQSFRISSNLDFDLELKEESLYNYFKLSYELDLPFSNLSQVMDQMSKFNLTKYTSEIKRMMINMFQSTNQYQEAFDFLKHHHLPEKEEKETLQRLSFYIAVQHYNNGNYNNALSMFKYSRNYPLNNEIDAMCIYWIADCYFNIGDYKSSINFYKLFLKTPSGNLFDKYGIAHYNLAYSFLRSKDNLLSIEHFRQAINNNIDDQRLHDAYMRLADNYYVISDFLKARDNYSKASDLSLFDKDYALYQQSRCASFLSRYEEQESILKKLENEYVDSRYYLEVLLDLASLYKNIQQDQKALDYYSMILSSSEDVDVIASCLLNQGLIYFNDDEFQKSIDLMKRIIVDFPMTNSVQQARLGLKKSYVILGEVKEYFDFLSENPSVDIDIASKDSIMFQVSLNFFEKKDYIKSREYFVEYLNQYSDGIFYLDATYFLAESNWNLNDSINAIKMYKSVIGFG